MKRSWFQMRFELSLLLLVFVTGCVHTTGPVFSNPQLNNSATDNSDDAAQLGVRDPGMVVHIDPKTGEIIAPSGATLSGQVSQPPLDASKKPLPELQQTLSPVPGGGVVIQLDERFMTPLTATIDADGKLRLEHSPTVSGSNEKE